MKRLTLLAAGLGVVGACKTTPLAAVDAPVPHDAAPPTASPPPSGASVVAPPSPPPKCGLDGAVVTIDDGAGKGSEYGTSSLENVRVLADGKKTVVTYERQSDFSVGDSSHWPVAAERSGREPFKSVDFPVMAYACATYGYIAPGSLDEPFVTWGVLNSRSFEVRKKLPTRNRQDGIGLNEAPERSIPTRRQSVNTVVVARDVALATTIDAACDDSCACPGTPLSFGLWLHRLDRKVPFSVRIATAKERTKAPDAPAIALGERGGAALYRHASALWIQWLDALGKPVDSPVRFDEGEVGAPAIALAGSDVVVAWARRASKTDPYQLRYARVPLNAAFPAPRTFVTGGSAFAPAVIADEHAMVLAWMEGDGGKSGQVYAARVAFADGQGEPFKVSGDEANARDPELSGTVAAPVLIHSSFDKGRPGGVVRVASLKCDDR